MKHKSTHNLVSQSVSQSVRHNLVESKSCVKSENVVEIC